MSFSSKTFPDVVLIPVNTQSEVLDTVLQHGHCLPSAHEVTRLEVKRLATLESKQQAITFT